MDYTTRLTLLLAVLARVQCEENALDGVINTAKKVIMDCISKQETTTCFKLKTVKFIDGIINSPEDVPLTDFMTLSRLNGQQQNYTADTQEEVLNEEELSASLPRQLDEKNQRLDQLLWHKFQTLLETRTFTLHAPVEGRGKKGGDKGYKGKGAMIMMMGGMMMKMIVMGSSMLSIKALMMAKAALILAGIVALKKLGGGGGGDSHPQVVLAHGGGGSGGASGGYYKQEPADPHEIAYGSHSQDQGYYNKK